MAKIWLKVKENGTKKIKLAKMVAKEKEILVRTLPSAHTPFHLPVVIYGNIWTEESS